MSRWFEITQNKVLAFALVCVAASSAFVMWMQITLVGTLSSPDWCARAINAEKLAAVRGQSSIAICADLFDKQLGSLAIGLFINAGTNALCLLVLIVIVVAGGKLKFKADASGIEGDIGRDATPVRVVNQPDDAVPVEPTP
jgi:hypothetical protein